MDYLYPVNFGISWPFHSRVRSRHTTDRLLERLAPLFVRVVADGRRCERRPGAEEGRDRHRDGFRHGGRQVRLGDGTR